MGNTFPQPDEESVETFPLGVRRYYLDDGEIAVVVGTGLMTREAIDEWADTVLDVIRQRAAADRPIYLLSDTSAQGQGFSNYARKRITEMHGVLPEYAPTYVAVLFSANIVLQIVRIFFEQLSRMTSKKLRVRTFTDRGEALAWLNQMREHAGGDDAR